MDEPQKVAVVYDGNDPKDKEKGEKNENIKKILRVAAVQFGFCDRI